MEPLLCGACISMCLPSIAPMQLRKCHREYKSSDFSFHSSSVGCSNSVGDNLFQIELQMDMIIKCTVVAEVHRYLGIP
jgi:excinuclease UvrABC ATPase subunit